jgi:hypothetical protein
VYRLRRSLGHRPYRIIGAEDPDGDPRTSSRGQPAAIVGESTTAGLNDIDEDSRKKAPELDDGLVRRQSSQFDNRVISRVS